LGGDCGGLENAVDREARRWMVDYLIFGLASFSGDHLLSGASRGHAPCLIRIANREKIKRDK
jgi:hypothetical protein